IAVVAPLGLPHHARRVREEPRRVRVALGVRERVMLAVQDGICARDQEQRPLRDEREQVEPAIPEPGQSVHAMYAVAVQEERLREDRQRPVGNEEDKYRGHIHFPAFIVVGQRLVQRRGLCRGMRRVSLRRKISRPCASWDTPERSSRSTRCPAWSATARASSRMGRIRFETGTRRVSADRLSSCSSTAGTGVWITRSCFTGRFPTGFALRVTVRHKVSRRDTFVNAQKFSRMRPYSCGNPALTGWTWGPPAAGCARAAADRERADPGTGCTSCFII